MTTVLTEIEKRAVRKYWDRKKAASKQKRVRNEDLPAGSPMYYYCSGCGCQSDVRGESDFGSRPCTECDGCKWLDKHQLMPPPKLD